MAEEKLRQPNDDNLKILKKIEALVGKKLNLVTEISYTTRGYVVDKDGSVAELGIWDCYISSKELQTLAGSLASLTKLTKLSLGSNRLTDVSVLKGLTKLTQLDLHDNQLTNISVLASLTNLTKLYLNGNDLANVSVLAKLTKLTELHLGHNRLTDVSVLGKLTNLTMLYLYNNNLTDISVLKNLPNLTILDLSDNNIKELPEWIIQLRMEIYCDNNYHDTGINLGRNPLETPPVEIVKNGREAIQVWCAAHEKGERQTLNEVKVLLVGDGDSGKTSTMKRLMKESYNPEEPQTHGIRINDWFFEHAGEQIKAHVWDFGGQDIMHATHQFFFTRRSLYVLLLNAREGPNPENWLKLIESFGGESPIIIVINKIDENPGFDINRKFLCEKYNNIHGIHRISCDTEEGIDIFRAALQNELADVEMIRQVWPQKWLKVKSDLEKLQKNYLNYDKYRRICKEHDIKKRKSQDILLNYLHELGVVLHFEELDLKDMQVLEPKWVTEAVYKIINSRTLADGKGVLNKDCMETILNEETFSDDAPLSMEQTTYTSTECGYLLGLMKKFELCHEMDDERALVPDLLDVEESTFEFDDSTALQFYFEYEFLPRSVIPRFIVRMYNDIEGELRWRTGVVLKCVKFGCRAVVRVDYEEGRIDIQVNGEQKQDYFAVIRHTIHDLNLRFTKINVREWIPLPDSEEAVEYKELLGHWLDGREEYYNGKLRRTFPVQKLLNGIEKPEVREEQRIIAGGDTYVNYGDNPSYDKGARHIQPGGDYVGRNQNKTGDIDSEMVGVGDGPINQTTVSVTPPIKDKSLVTSIIWRAAGSFIAVSCVALAVLYVPEWKVKAALITGAAAALLSIIFNPKTWHRRAALCLLMLMGAAQVSFELYGRFYLSPEDGGWGSITLSGPALFIQAIIVVAAVIIYVVGEIFSKRNE